MKNLQSALIMLVGIFFLSSCQADPGCITQGQAFNLAWGFSSYRFGFYVAILLIPILFFVTRYLYVNVKIGGTGGWPWWIIYITISLLLLLFAICLPVSSLMETTTEMYLRGGMIR